MLSVIKYEAYVDEDGTVHGSEHDYDELMGALALQFATTNMWVTTDVGGMVLMPNCLHITSVTGKLI